jgi:alkylhydroperoxidase family enzyme
MKLTNAKVRRDIEALERRITEGPGTVPAEQRRAAADAKPVEGSAALAAYLEKVRKHAYKVTDEEVAALRAAGATDDELFELTVAAAFGAAKERLGAGLAAVATVYEES